MDEEVDLQIDSLAYGGNGVARLNGFVVFVRQGPAGRPRPGARDEGEARVCGGDCDRCPRAVAEPSRGSVHALPGLRRLPLPGSDYAVQAAAKEDQVRDALRRIGGIPEPPLEPILPAESPFFYRNKMEYSFAQTPEGPALGFHKAGRWDEVLEIEKCWLTTDLGN